MSQSSTDLRTKRSHKYIREALIDLIEEKGFESLSVSEITQRAMVSRATFYRIYLDKYDLVEKIFSEAMQALLDTVSEINHEHPPQVWGRFFEHIGEYERLYRVLLGKNGSPWFVSKMRASITELIKGYEQYAPLQDIALARDPLLSDYVRDIISTLLVETITWWLENNRPFPPKEIALRCGSLASSIFLETSKWRPLVSP
jgi:AcrR family transcriptional regulator